MKFFALALLAWAPAWAEVTVHEYLVPEGHGVHDIWADSAADGPVWFSAEISGRLGILHPKSGKIDFVSLGEGSSPHGVIAAADGAPWLTDRGRNAIVRVDAKTHAVKAWKLPPDHGHVNLHSAAFDASGILWFTGQAGIYGRLDPDSGAFRLFPAPKGPGPFGMHATAQGEIYYASFTGSYIAHIDRASGDASVIEPPTPRQGARRLWSDSRGNIWVAEWYSGNVSRYEPASGKWMMWKPPGREPHVYAIYVDETDKVWVSEWSAQVMLRLDPATGKFETFHSSSRSPRVRQIHGRRGEVWTAESAADKVVVYRFR